MSGTATPITPTDECFCGCGRETPPGAFFRTGHDKKASADLDALHHDGSVAQRLAHFGFGPGLRNLHEYAIERGVRERCGIDGCNVSGVPKGIGMRRHRATHAKGKPSEHGSD